MLAALPCARAAALPCVVWVQQERSRAVGRPGPPVAVVCQNVYNMKVVL